MTQNTKILSTTEIHNEGNPGRPVVSSVNCNCHTANITKYFRLPPSTNS